MRLNRFLARSGAASRRGADDLIRSGRVTVNGNVVTELGTTIDTGRDTVELDGNELSLPHSLTYVILNKPPDCVVTLSDPQGRKTVMDLIPELPPGVVPVGRLDAPTEGLLIMTDDGDLAHRIAHPSFEMDKVYEVRARGVLSEEARRKLESGVELDGMPTAPAEVRVVSTTHDSTAALVTIHEGRKRQVRRMFELVGHPVVRLRRVRIGPIELGDLGPGRWRPLTGAETERLRAAVGLGKG
jgi:23S rRNA pseudouridine2605 synthase